jgi:16S rRNA (cytidine1402-2'-O)-methyltransferase
VSSRGADDPGTRPGLLWVVATPIGNLEDLPPRAARALVEADLVAAEDTRRARILLQHVGAAGKALVRLDAHAERGEAVDRVVERLRAGARVALVTDAGTPVVSDPGTALVRAARAAGVTVSPVPGPSAVTAAISASGLVDGPFRFLGFLPRGGDERREAIARMQGDHDAQVLFESPNRLTATLVDLATAMPDREAVVGRELTKLHEEILGGTLSALAAGAAGREWLGEITVVIGSRPEGDEARVALADEDVLSRVDAGLAAGERPRDLAERLALETGRPRRDLYALAVQRRAR